MSTVSAQPSVAHQADILRAAVCVAAMDGNVCPTEMRCLRVLAERIGVGERSLQRLIHQARNRPDFYQQQFQALSADADFAIKSLLYVASVDGRVCEDERIVIRHFAESLGVDDARFEQILKSAERHAEMRNDAKA
ncbi:MAG: hypothetical protein GC159_12495 [Phycisphaera sp.]|nr:hypothetical protein [Phycisphaera sp.]